MNIPRQVQIELVHGQDLCVAATGGAAFDTKGRTLRGLTNARDGGFAENGAEALRQANSGGALAFAQRCGVNASDDDVVAVGFGLATGERGECDLGFGSAPGNDFCFG